MLHGDPRLHIKEPYKNKETPIQSHGSLDRRVGIALGCSCKLKDGTGTATLLVTKCCTANLPVSAVERWTTSPSGEAWSRSPRSSDGSKPQNTKILRDKDREVKRQHADCWLRESCSVTQGFSNHVLTQRGCTRQAFSVSLSLSLPLSLSRCLSVSVPPCLASGFLSLSLSPSLLRLA